MSDEALARRLVVQPVDLPGGGWERSPSGTASRGETDDDDLDVCLAGFPDDGVTATADSDRFSRADALAYSVVWVLASETAAGAAFDVLAGDAFADCFTERVAAAVSPEPGGAELLGHVTSAPTDLPLGARAAVHRARLAAGTPAGTFAVHLDLVALQRGRAATLVFLADSPDPLPGADVTSTAARIAGRLPL